MSDDLIHTILSDEIENYSYEKKKKDNKLRDPFYTKL